MGRPQVDGHKIRRLRQAIHDDLARPREGSQMWLADRIGVNVISLSRWERGLSQPHRSTIPAIADALGVPVTEILSGVLDGAAPPGGPFPAGRPHSGFARPETRAGGGVT